MSASSGLSEERLVSQWRQLLLQHANIWSELDRRLHAQHRLTASAFEVLERLAEANEHKLRVQELTENTHLSQSALSRLIAHMEKDALVKRCICDEDRRGILVKLTEAGKEHYLRARPTHRAVLSAFTIDEHDDTSLKESVLR